MAAVLLLLAHALTNSWVWGAAVAAGAAAAFAAAVALFVRYVGRHPEKDRAWMNLLGATAFGAGGRGAERADQRRAR
jgi:hypothetical protein